MAWGSSFGDIFGSSSLGGGIFGDPGDPKITDKIYPTGSQNPRNFAGSNLGSTPQDNLSAKLQSFSEDDAFDTGDIWGIKKGGGVGGRGRNKKAKPTKTGPDPGYQLASNNSNLFVNPANNGAPVGNPFIFF